MRKVIVTGAGGFIGRHCLELLVEAGFEVHALGFPEPAADSENLYWYTCNLHDYSQTARLLKDIEAGYMLHLAWYTTWGRYAHSLENLRWVQSSLELVKYFRACGGKRLVVAGSCWEYDLHYGYLQEDITPDGHNSLYGTCKSGLSRMLAAYSLETGLSSAWGRIFYVYGPYENPGRVVPYVINRLLNNEAALCANGEKVLDYLYVKDVAAALVALLQSNVNGTVNVASGVPICLKDLLAKIGQKMGKANLIAFNGKPQVSDEPGFIVASSKKMGTQVGWEPAYNLEVGLDETIIWWKTLAARR